MTPKQFNDLGDQYFYGKGQTKNVELAFTYYKQAADLNNPVGYYNVGRYFLEKKDYKQAIDYLSKAKELGYAKAAMKLSDMYLTGQGVRKSKKKSFKFMETAAELNDLTAYARLGGFYLDGIGVKRDEMKAYEYFETAANKNSPEGMYLLGELLLNARQIKQDHKNGFFWLDKAASNNSVEAINRLKDIYASGHIYFRKKSQLYMKEMWFYYDELLAKLDDPEALARTAFAYYEGNEVVKINYDKAYLYFTNLYNQDNTNGYLGLGLINLYGLGTNEDFQKAKDYLEIAATRKNAKAMNALGDMYRLGKGVNVDYSRAKDFYFEAAKEEETNALVNLGLLHYRKQIPQAKNEMALQYMTRASEKHNAQAYYWLGIFYDKGVGCEPSFQKAERYFLESIYLDNLGAKYKYASLLYEYLPQRKISGKKKNEKYIVVKELLLDYILNPAGNTTNQMYSMYTLGEMFFSGYGVTPSDKISRYWFEMSATSGLAKGMVRMYFLLKETEPDNAVDWLLKAVKNPQDGEELYELANLYMTGFGKISKDERKAYELYGKASSLGYQLAKEKLTMA